MNAINAINAMNTANSCSSINEMGLSENDTPKSDTSYKNEMNDNGVMYTIDIPVETDNTYDNDMNSKIDKALQGTQKNEKRE